MITNDEQFSLELKELALDFFEEEPDDVMLENIEIVARNLLEESFIFDDCEDYLKLSFEDQGGIIKSYVPYDLKEEIEIINNVNDKEEAIEGLERIKKIYKNSVKMINRAIHDAKKRVN